MVKATLTTYKGGIVQSTFDDMDALTDYLKEHPGEYEAIVAKVVKRTKDIRQGRTDRKAV